MIRHLDNLLTSKYSFFLKLLCVFFLSYLFAILIIIQIENSFQEVSYKYLNFNKITRNLRDEFTRDITRIRAKGLITNNPEVHYKIAIIEFKNKDYQAAIEEIELGIGLLHSNKVNDEYKEKFMMLKDEIIKAEKYKNAN